MPLESNPITTLFENYTSAVLAKDVDRFLELYSDDTLVFDSWGMWEFAGVDAWRPMVTMWFESLGDKLCEARFTEVVATVRDDVAFAHAAVRYAEVTEDGEQVDSMMNRITVTLEKSDGEWKITHEHTSMPLDMESAKGIFDAYEKRDAR
ncbi:YybH family protein [Agreia sp.]|uniref:YybH family protein n=1 Tax=Agreia sp. TaxID=1872416 RepID=UPI0035BC4194